MPPCWRWELDYPLRCPKLRRIDDDLAKRRWPHRDFLPSALPPSPEPARHTTLNAKEELSLLLQLQDCLGTRFTVLVVLTKMLAAELHRGTRNGF